MRPRLFALISSRRQYPDDGEVRCGDEITLLADGVRSGSRNRPITFLYRGMHFLHDVLFPFRLSRLKVEQISARIAFYRRLRPPRLSDFHLSPFAPVPCKIHHRLRIYSFLPIKSLNYSIIFHPRERVFHCQTFC
jgi:hypothetical protein